MMDDSKIKMKPKQKRSVTLVELLIAIFLLSAVVVTAVTVELAVRRMQIKPSIDAKLLDELIPVVNRIRKDFEGQIGSQINSSLSIEESGRRLVIRVDSDNSANVTAADQRHAYRWSNVPGGAPIEYSPNNTTFNEILAQGILDFSVSAANNNTALTLIIKIKKDPLQPEDPVTNPAVNLTTTIFSRMTSGR